MIRLNFDIKDFIEEKPDRVQFLLNFFPETRTNYALLIAYYWKLFNGIDIDNKVLNQIKNRATQPETISRYKRMIAEGQRNNVLNDLLNIVNEMDA